MPASVIVCTRNRAGLLKRALRSLVNQDAAPGSFEVVVVDDGSTDETRAVCGEMGKRLTGLRCVRSTSQKGIAAARNLGAEAARSDRLVFFDDDCVAAPGWLDAMCDALSRHPVVMGAIDTPPAPLCTVADNLNQFHRFMPEVPAGPVTFLASSNLGITRRALDLLGAFDESLPSGEDTDLVLRARRLGLTAVFHPPAHVTHIPPPLTFWELLEKTARRSSQTIRIRRSNRDQLGMPFVLRSPTLLRLASPVLAGGVVALALLRNPGLVKYAWCLPALFVLKIAWCFGAASGLRR